MASNAKTVEAVLIREVQEIKSRREISQRFSPRTPDETAAKTQSPESVADTLTGIALSGGGVRSGAFSLGFLQALYSRGRLRFIDYLSTVSGGGYAGALFSTLASSAPEGLEWGPRRGDCDGRNRLDIESPDGMQQPERVQQLAMHGRMMTNSLRFFSRHLWGWLLNTAFVVSGIVCGAAFVALLMKWLWRIETAEVLGELGAITDIRVAYFPALIALMLWVVTHALQFVARIVRVRIPPIATGSYLLLMTSLALGTVALLATGDVGVTALVSIDSIAPERIAQLQRVQHSLLYAAGTFFVVTLLPLIRPQRLLESGRAPKKLHERFLFHAAGLGLVIGVPLFVFFLMCRENVSEHLKERPNASLPTRSYFETPEKFQQHLKDDKVGSVVRRHLASKLLGVPVVSETPTVKIANERDSLLAKAWRLADERTKAVNEINKDVSVLTRWYAAIGRLFGNDNDFVDRVKKRADTRLAMDHLVSHLNDECLSNPELFDLTPATLLPRGANHTDLVPQDSSKESFVDWWLRQSLSDPETIETCEANLRDIGVSRVQLEELFEERTPLQKSSTWTIQNLREIARSQVLANAMKSDGEDLVAIEPSIITLMSNGRPRVSTLSYADFKFIVGETIRSLTRTGAPSALEARVRSELLRQLTDAQRFEEIVKLAGDESRERLKAIRTQLTESLDRIRKANWQLLTAIYPKKMRQAT